MAAVMAGACGYLLKDSSIDQLIAGIRAAASGESLISPQIAAKVLQRLRAQTPDTAAAARRSAPSSPTASSRSSADRDRQGQRRDRTRPLHQPQDREEPHLEHSHEAADREPHPGGRLRGPQRDRLARTPPKAPRRRERLPKPLSCPAPPMGKPGVNGKRTLVAAAALAAALAAAARLRPARRSSSSSTAPSRSQESLARRPARSRSTSSRAAWSTACTATVRSAPRRTRSWASRSPHSTGSGPRTASGRRCSAPARGRAPPGAAGSCSAASATRRSRALIFAGWRRSCAPPASAA